MNKKYSTLDNIIKIDNPWVIIIGTISTGKSHVIRELHNYNKKQVLASVVISPQENTFKFYNNFIDNNYIYEEFYNRSILDRILERQKLLINSNYYKTEVIFDCCFSSKCYWPNNNDIKYLFNNKNDHKLTVIMSFRIPHRFPNEIKNKFDYVFILNEYFISTKKKLYELYGSQIFNTYEEFDKIMCYDVETFDCLVLDMINKKYFIYNSHKS
jgi:hypothetical protein